MAATRILNGAYGNCQAMSLGVSVAAYNNQLSQNMIFKRLNHLCLKENNSLKMNQEE